MHFDPAPALSNETDALSLPTVLALGLLALAGAACGLVLMSALILLASGETVHALQLLTLVIS